MEDDLKFYDKDVKKNMEGVIMEIRNWIITHPLPPSYRGELNYLPNSLIERDKMSSCQQQPI
jgi:hypothetical protein